MIRKQLIIFLAGGVGNQLFQLCAGRSISEGREIVGELGFSGTRNPDQSNPAIADLFLAQDINLIRSWKSRLVTQKIFDILIGVSTKTRGLKSQGFFRSTLELCGTIYFSCYYKKIVYVSISKGVGYYDIPKKSGNQLIIGYFQSYRYSGEVSSINKCFEIDPINPGSDFRYLKSQAIIEKPIMVHIRLGDYLSESNFGILTSGYYEWAINQFKTTRKLCPIWVFTDDIEGSKKLFAEFLPENVNWIGDVDNSIGSTLALFRYGAGYVIANSSFSWWAAWSRHDRTAKVIHPKPWFVGLDTPLNLTPPDWESLPGHTKESK